MKTPCSNCDCPRCRCACHEDEYGSTPRERRGYTLGFKRGWYAGFIVSSVLRPRLITDLLKSLKHKKGSGNAALLVLLIGTIIILYLLFMPPGAREALLNGVP